MKALLLLVLGSIVLTGCATNSTQMSAEDRALWDTDEHPPEASGAPAR